MVDLNLANSQVQDGITYLNYASTSFPKSKIALNSFVKAACALPEGPRQNWLDASLNDFRARVGKILRVPATSIFFTHGATVGLNQVIRGFMKDGLLKWLALVGQDLGKCKLDFHPFS